MKEIAGVIVAVIVLAVVAKLVIRKVLPGPQPSAPAATYKPVKNDLQMWLQ